MDGLDTAAASRVAIKPAADLTARITERAFAPIDGRTRAGDARDFWGFRVTPFTSHLPFPDLKSV